MFRRPGRSFSAAQNKALAISVALFAASSVLAQSLPNPYRNVDGWAKLPDGRQMGAVGGVTMDPDGSHLWAVDPV